MDENIRQDNYDINSINDFIKFVENMHNIGYTWFRGQTNKDWDIEPGLTRTATNMQSNEEVKMIVKKTKQFNILIDKAEHAIKHKRTYKTIKHLKLNRIQLMMLAQHHGLITPFLDWTTNPNIALFFSLYSNKLSELSPVIYATNPKLLNYGSDRLLNGDFYYGKFNSEDPRLVSFVNSSLKKIEGNDGINSFIYPLAIETNLDFSHRITFQSGKFTINGPKKPHESKKFKDEDYPEYPETQNTQKINIVAKISTKVIEELKTYLESLGYTSETVYRLGDKNTIKLDKLFKRISHFKYNQY